MNPFVRNKPLRWTLRVAVLVAAAWALAPFYCPASRFVPLASDPRVRCERGAEKMAADVAEVLPAAIAAVEAAQGRAFPKPVNVFVCATERSFEHRGYGVAGAGGYVFHGRLFLSPKPQNTRERLPRLLTHELSHLHLEQCRGMLSMAQGIPAWFKEGLAVHVSGGGGAETVSEAEARDAIAKGQIFSAQPTGSLFFPQTGKREGLKPHLFYRESGMFVAYLAKRDASAFGRALSALENGGAFADTLQQECGRTVAELQREFVAEVRHAWDVKGAARDKH